MDKRGVQPWVAQLFSVSVFLPRQPLWRPRACSTSWLATSRTRWEVPLEEAVLAARDVLEYLEQNLLIMTLGQIQFPAISGRENHKKHSRANQPEKLISLTVVAEEDIEFMAEFGTVSSRKAVLPG